MKAQPLLFVATYTLSLLAWSSASHAHSLPDSSLLKDHHSSHEKCTGGKQGDFTHYILAEAYPATLCQSDKTFTCSYPKNVTSWTIHGLWPVHGNTNGPTCCDPNANFNKDSIQSLVPRLVKEWTNLKREQKFYRVWSHEWIKHGTCCPDSLRPEYNYLNTTLTLFETDFNFGSILSSAGIRPSNYYTADDIRAAFGKGVVGEIRCSKINKKATLTEIRICLSKSFKTTQCPGGGKRFRRTNKKESADGHGCAEGSKIFYAPTENTS